MAPNIFTQVFTILGVVTRATDTGESKVALPFVYALLTSKEGTQYAKVLQAEGELFLLGIPTTSGISTTPLRMIKPKPITSLKAGTIDSSY